MEKLDNYIINIDFNLDVEGIEDVKECLDDDTLLLDNGKEKALLINQGVINVNLSYFKVYGKKPWLIQFQFNSVCDENGDVCNSLELIKFKEGR
jgi:hypothetical protein